MRKVELHTEEVKGVILETFGCRGFTMLDCAKGGYLLRSDEELTANIAIYCRGALYLCEAAVVSLILSSYMIYM